MSSIELDLSVKMRDGVELSTIVVRPNQETPLPAVLIRTPYSAQNMFQLVKAVSPLFRNAWVLQDTRGCYNSGGAVFHPFEEREDTLDTIAWIRQQEWCNGEIHIFGPSYLGFVGLQVLDDEEANITSLFAPMTFSRPEKGLVYRSGVLHLHWALPWSILTTSHNRESLERIKESWPTGKPESLAEAVRRQGEPDHVWKLFLNPPEERVWQKLRARFTRPLTTRVTLLSGWYDFMLQATFTVYEELMQHDGIPPDLIIGPWGHNGYMQSQGKVGDYDYGDQGKGNPVADFQGAMNRAHMKSPQVIRAFILRANRWIDLEAWPPKTCTQQIWFLDTKETLSKRPSTEQYEPEFPVNPLNPVPTLGGAVWEFEEYLMPGPADQRSLSERKDILRYYTPPFEQSLILLGPASANLWVRTGVPETHFTTKLVLVESDDSQRLLRDGIIPVLGPQKVYKPIEVDMLAVGVEVREGERIGLEVSWSNFPKYALPPLFQPTNQSISLGSTTPSSLNLTVIP